MFAGVFFICFVELWKRGRRFVTFSKVVRLTVRITMRNRKPGGIRRA